MHSDAPALRAAIAQWHPDVSVGAASCYLEQDFYETTAALAGEAERDLLVVLLWKNEEFVGFASWDRERAGYQLPGVAPGYDRELVTPGVVKSVYEAWYAKVLVPEEELLRPDPAKMTPKTRQLLESLFPRFFSTSPPSSNST